MIRPIVLIFIILSILFAFTHYVAVLGSLYYFYWWLDLPMHFWGGCLLALGLYTFSTFQTIKFKPSFKLLLLLLLVATVAWELFEWQIGLGDLKSPIGEALKDIMVGFSGGLLTHLILAKYTIES